jgi:iron(III) transport system permease protein
VTPLWRRWSAATAALPLGLLLGITALPLIYLLTNVSGAGFAPEWSSVGPSLEFAVVGGAIATVVGGAIGVLFSMREFPGRRGLLAMAIVPIAAPPAFWWIGATRLTSAWGSVSGLVPAAVVAGFALAPVTLLFVFAAARQVPSNLYEAARVAFPPVTRLVVVLLPLLWSSLVGGFVLTVILLLGESELPFLFGFRTGMTDIVTVFAQSYDVRRTMPYVVPLLVVIVAMGGLAARPVMRAVLTSSRGTHGMILRKGGWILSLWAAVPAAFVALSVAGYVSAIASSPDGWPRMSTGATTALVSIFEPVACAWIALIATLSVAFAARRSAAMPAMLSVALMLFCVPAAIYALGWVGIGQIMGGLAIPPLVAHMSRAVALAMLGFGVGFSRMPRTLDDAAALVQVSTLRRAFVFLLPLVRWSLAATSALIAALTYADRDVASLLLPPGASRLTLNLYLASANAPSAVIGALALVAILGAALAVALSALGPALLWRMRG